MKIVSWNVNGLRAVLKNREKSLKSFLDDLEADIICLQETKATRLGLDRSSCVTDGYTSFFSFCKVKGGYSGVATFCRDSATPVRAEEGLTGTLTPANDGVGLTRESHAHFSSKDEMLDFDGEGRAVLTEHSCEEGREGGGGGGGGGNLVVFNVYCPMVDRENVNAERLSYKMMFYSVLQDRCTALERAGKQVVVAGDLNCSREAIDSAYIQDTPTLLHGSPEREWMKTFVASRPLPFSPSSPSVLIDTFRYLHPERAQAYTCWSTFLGYRKTNYGTRIDYILCSSSLAPLLCQAEVWAEETGSDHCPVMADFPSLSLLRAPRAPSLSLHLLLGRQTTLFSFVEPLPSSLNSKDSQQGVKVSAKNSSEASGKGVKRKLSEISSTSKAPRKLQSFFNPSNSTSSPSTSGKTECVTERSSEQATEDGGERVSLPPSSSAQLKPEWSSLFSGPPKPPLCRRHREPAILRTVRKAGPTRGRQFWACSRPAGSKSDPSTQCDFFQWLSTSRTKK